MRSQHFTYIIKVIASFLNWIFTSQTLYTKRARTSGIPGLKECAYCRFHNKYLNVYRYDKDLNMYLIHITCLLTDFPIRIFK